uniref:Uncharacterized protein n=1 Tax=Daucus carota subsp. sativus TaxID=79200 RepID=A0A166IA05_DAUCS
MDSTTNLGCKRNKENAMDGSFSGCNLTPLSTWHFNGNHGHGFNSQITSTGRTNSAGFSLAVIFKTRVIT